MPNKTPHHPRKRFGQNFLQDQQVIARIIQSLHLSLRDHVLEIGPGQGALTLPMAPLVGQLDTLEIDRDLYQLLAEKSQGYPQWQAHLGDALKCQLQHYRQDPRLLRVVGNLPYNISTPLMFHLLSQIEHVQDMHFMLQQEVVQRLCAPVNTPHYGRLSVMMQYACATEYLFTVPATAFSPQPKVESAIVRLTPRQQLEIQDFQHFTKLVTQAFNQRRKTLRNSLKNTINEQQFIDCDINPDWRPQQLSVENFVKLANISCS